jgi:hypothetical protein
LQHNKELYPRLASITGPFDRGITRLMRTTMLLLLLLLLVLWLKLVWKKDRINCRLVVAVF